MELEDLGGCEAAVSVEGQRRFVVLGDDGVALDLAIRGEGGDEPAYEFAAEALALVVLVDRHGQHLGPSAHTWAGGGSVAQGLEHLAPRTQERTKSGDGGGRSVVDQELSIQGAGRVGAGDEPDDLLRPAIAHYGHEQKTAVPQDDPAVEALEEAGSEE